MTALLALLGVAVQAVLLAVIVIVAAAVVWVLWDCTTGPSARLAAEARARREVDGW